MATGCYVAYFRVSTDRQGRSGLGLDAQREAVAAFLDGGGRRVVAEFQEVESGRDDDRPELAKAVARCRLTGSKLLIAKMDRLARGSPSSPTSWTAASSSRSPTCPA